jgi:glycosyltransferase involved in cell wall biosynthesis
VPSVPTRGGKREGIPVVVMEALAAGKALVASDLSGIPEIVRHEDTGLLAAPGDARAIADAIRRLYDDADLRARLGAAGRAEVNEAFNLHTNAATLVDLFRTAPQAS